MNTSNRPSREAILEEMWQINKDLEYRATEIDRKLPVLRFTPGGEGMRTHARALHDIARLTEDVLHGIEERKADIARPGQLSPEYAALLLKITTSSLSLPPQKGERRLTAKVKITGVAVGSWVAWSWLLHRVLHCVQPMENHPLRLVFLLTALASAVMVTYLAWLIPSEASDRQSGNLKPT